jgi:hypothetical protein
MTDWLLLTYKLPSEPSARRVYIWRKMRKLGAETIFEAVWVLPGTSRTREQFQWLASEIQEMGGEAMLWSARAELIGQEQELIDRFSIQVETAYRGLLASIGRPNPDWANLAQAYQQIRQRDYFQSSLGQQVRDQLLAARGGSEL